MKAIVPVARRVKAPVSDDWIKKTVIAALQGAGVKASAEVGIVFVDDKEMTKLNAAHRGKKKTTDVLSFGTDGVWPQAGDRGLLGDVIISVAQAGRQAKTAGKPLRSELAMLIVHGCLHLLGHDHETVKEEKAMFALQGRILKTLGYV